MINRIKRLRQFIRFQPETKYLTKEQQAFPQVSGRTYQIKKLKFSIDSEQSRKNYR